MNLYQIEITTDADFVTITVNADDENEAISIGVGMFDAGQLDTVGSSIVNIAAFPACM
ncbi:hypothetical protein [Prevotella sp.]|uniref:hypothetical protein n=1 Tax=Prevotella sp. TaxID=59823 RepID=UPI0025FE06F9|nr:hypothetical protein [Prevotella sp.]